MNKQPPALEMADDLLCTWCLPIHAAQLRRLHEVNQELLSACRKALYALKGREHDQFLRDAIAKATGDQE